jgi:serine/threonine protein kinase
LRQEAKILTGLGHENVIDLYGVSNKDKVDKLDTFLVMDILKDTLESKLVVWSRRQKKVTPAGVVSVRLREVAFGIAAGMEYLHSNRILFRYVCLLCCDAEHAGVFTALRDSCF